MKLESQLYPVTYHQFLPYLMTGKNEVVPRSLEEENGQMGQNVEVPHLE